MEEGFKPLIDNKAIHVVHIETGTSGACRETKRISDYAYERGIDTAIHMAGSPVGSMASAHTAATLNSFIAQECHAIDFLDWWQKLVNKPIIVEGYIPVPDTPGLGIELNEAVIKEHLRYPGYFDGVVTGAPAMRTGYSNLADRYAATMLNQVAPKDASGTPLTAQEWIT